jgi:hypothetical protein
MYSSENVSATICFEVTVSKKSHFHIVLLACWADLTIMRHSKRGAACKNAQLCAYAYALHQYDIGF